MTDTDIPSILNSSSRPPAWRTRISSAVLALGIIYTICLLSQVRTGVFYSGDGGLKALMVKQFAAGRIGDDLVLPAEPWVRQLWDRGFYPFGPPFVYELPHGRVVTFPLWFMVLTAPFYRLFGPAGLYFIPVASLWLLWFRFVAVSRRLGLPMSVTSAALFAMIFCTPLTLYGAMFWEHTLGVLLAFCGIEYLLTRMPTRQAARVTILWGVLAGFAVWIRSELICLIAVVGAVATVIAIRHRRRGAGWFVAGLMASVASLLIINRLAYGSFLGTHGFQIKGQPIQTAGGAGYQPLLADLVTYAPLTAFVLFALLIRACRSAEATERLHAGLLAVIIASFLALVPWIIPNLGGKQWGPRYLLVLMPLLSLLAGMLLVTILRIQQKTVRYSGVILFVLSLAVGGYLNTCVGFANLAGDYRMRVKPAMDFLLADSTRLVAVTRQWTAQELATAFEQKEFFWTHDPGRLGVLASRARHEGHSRFLLVAAPEESIPSWIAADQDDSPITGVHIKPVGVYGDYAIYTAEAIAK